MSDFEKVTDNNHNTALAPATPKRREVDLGRRMEHVLQGFRVLFDPAPLTTGLSDAWAI